MATNGANQINLFTTEAHVFQLNPETKNSWMPRCKTAVPVSFVVTSDPGAPDEPKRCELRLIGTGAKGESVLNSLILPQTNFQKRAAKFGQWIDPAGNLYGLGFGTEAEMTEFASTFQRLQDEASPKPRQQHHPQDISDQQSQPVSQQGEPANWSQQQQQSQLNPINASETNGRHSAKIGSGNMQQYTYSPAHPAHQIKREPQTTGHSNGDASFDSDTNNNKDAGDYAKSQSMFALQSRASAGKASPEGDETSAPQSEWQTRDQLKYENDRLKQALEESSKNTGIWHSELLNLRTNNVKLTQALQESKAHVEEWERELTNLRDENRQLKSRIATLESNVHSDALGEVQSDVQKWKNYVDDAKIELKRKDLEIEELQRSMGELELRAQNAGRNGRESNMSEEHKQKLDIINSRLEAKLGELLAVQRDFAQVMDDMDQ